MTVISAVGVNISVGDNMSDYLYRYTKREPRFDIKGIAYQHQHWARSLTEPFTEQQTQTLEWLYQSTPPEQRKYVIISDKPVKCGTNRISYQLKANAGWIQTWPVLPKEDK